MSLTGKVLRWYNWEVRKVPFADWKAFKTKLLKRFGTTRNLTPLERLFALRQEGMVDDFVTDFEDLSSQVDNLEDDSLKSIFKNGLKPELKALVRMLKPKGLTELIETTIEIEASIISRMVGGALMQEISGYKNRSTFVSQNDGR